MKSIQCILIILSLLAATVGSIAFHSRLAYRLLAVLFFLAAVLFIIFPDTTTEIAHFFGVGRGTDLLLYLVIFAGIHSFLLLFIRLRRLERKLTTVIRALAINTAKHPEPATLARRAGHT